MRHVELGTTGVKVSEMCLGTMMFGDRCAEAEGARILAAAIEHNVNFVDTAAMYGQGRTEEILGRIIKGKRDQLFIATKVHKGVDARSIQESIGESLARLQTDHVDLYLIHWPAVTMHPGEVMAALDAVVRQGKARFVGCCNYPAWLFAHSNAIAVRNGWTPLVCNQVPYNLFERGIELEILPQAVAERVAITVYRPLSAGLLAGKYVVGEDLPAGSRGAANSRIAVWFEKYSAGIRQFNEFAAQRDILPSQLAIAWVRHAPGVTAPIVGVSSLRQLEEGVRAFDVNLTADEYEEVTGMFDTAIKEEGGGKFIEWRRTYLNR